MQSSDNSPVMRRRADQRDPNAVVRIDGAFMSQPTISGPGFGAPKQVEVRPSAAEDYVEGAGAMRLAGDDEPSEASGAAKRVLALLLAAIVLIPVFLFLIEWAGIKMSPLFIFLLVAPFVVAVIAAGASEEQKPAKRKEDPGRPVGCCPGPGTLPSSRCRH